MRWVLLPLLLASALPAAEGPRLEVDPGRRLTLAGLPPILAEEGVKENLTKGLTTSIYFSLGAKPSGGKLAGGARIDVRYDLWDEVFHLTTVELGRGGGEVSESQAASFDDLLAWWRELRLALVDGTRLAGAWPRRLRVTATVVPFSQSESDDAETWFSESLDRAAESGTGEVGRAGEQPTDSLSKTFNLLLATSIRRRALASYRWNLTVPPADGADPEDPP